VRTFATLAGRDTALAFLRLQTGASLMSRLLPLLFCLLLVLSPVMASARVAGPEAWQSTDTVRDLAEIRRSGVLRVLVNQSRNSSGEVKGEAIGVEYARLRAFEQHLNRDAASGRSVARGAAAPRG